MASKPSRPKLKSLLGPGNYRRIAREAGLTPAHVGRVLNGKRGSNFFVAGRIALAAGVSLDDLHQFLARLDRIAPGRRTRGDNGVPA